MTTREVRPDPSREVEALEVVYAEDYAWVELAKLLTAVWSLLRLRSDELRNNNSNNSNNSNSSNNSNNTNNTNNTKNDYNTNNDDSDGRRQRPV